MPTRARIRELQELLAERPNDDQARNEYSHLKAIVDSIEVKPGALGIRVAIRKLTPALLRILSVEAPITLDLSEYKRDKT